MVEKNTNGFDSISEPVFDSDFEKKPKSDLEPGAESVLDSASGVGFELTHSEMIRVSL